jgi:hypothetical protein
LELNAVQIGFVALLFTAGAALAALFRLVSTAVESLRKETLAELDRRDALNSKARHDGNGRIAADMLKLEAAVATLQRETVRREDLQQIENRLAQQIARLDGKMDLVGDKLSGFVVLEKQVQQMDARLGQALRRLEIVPAPSRDREPL